MSRKGNRVLMKRVRDLEERIKRLESERTIVINPSPQPFIIPSPGTTPWYPAYPTYPVYPDTTPWTVPLTWGAPCPLGGNHEYPSHYYAPDGRIPCSKCGQSIGSGITITCDAQAAVGHSGH